MDRRKLIATGGAAALTAAAAPAAALAGGTSDEDLVGSWFGTVTAEVPPIGSFNDLITVHPGGVVTESRRYAVPTPFGQLLETTGHGAWRKTGAKSYEAFFRFLLQNADTSDFGTDNIHLWLTLDPKAGTLSGTFESQVKDTGDAVLLTVTGTWSGTAITV